MRLIQGLSFLLGVLVARQFLLSGAGVSPAPVLVELFTSEGCSSCPPADRWLQQLDASQPIPNVELIVLSEHVDYWDHDGWKDPHSSHLWTERQSAYVSALHLREPYTPQLIVDGSMEISGNDPSGVTRAFQNAAAAPKIPVRVASVSVDTSKAPVLRAAIEADGAAASASGDIYVAVALNRVESQVLHGENGGQHLTHVAVVQELVKVGKLVKGKTSDVKFQRALRPGTEPSNVRIVAFVQEAGTGRVIGAAMKKVLSD